MRYALLFLVTTVGIVRADEPPPNELLPLAIGNTWTYRVANQDERFVVKVVGLEKIGDQLAFKLEGSLRDRVVATEYLLSDSKGIRRLRLDKDDIMPPLDVCKVPTQKTELWKTNFRLGMRYGIAAYTMTSDVAVTVPGTGKTTAIKVDVDTTDNGVRVRSSYWFAPKIGIVKQTIDEAKRVTTLELEKYELK